MSDGLLPGLHAAIKRSPRAHKLARRLIRLFLRIRRRVRRPRSGRHPPPLAVRSVKRAPPVGGEAPLRGRARCLEVYESRSLARRLPFSLEPEVHWKFLSHRRVHWAPSLVAEIPGGRVWGAGEAAISHDGFVLTELTRAVGPTEDYLEDVEEHPIFQQADLGPPRRLEGPAAVLSSPGGGGYYHWMMDVLPRIHLLLRAGYRIEEIDTFLVNGTSAGYQRETLATLGVDRSRVLETRWNPHVRGDPLIFPSLPGEFGHVARWACDFLRDRFLPAEEGGDRLLYLNRRRVTHRRVRGEARLIARLEARGFVDTTLESLSVVEQARALAGARIVVAPHGAGLTNIVFCRPGTRVVEIHSPRDVSHVYWALADTMGLEYAYVIGEGRRPRRGADPHDGEGDIRIRPEAVEELLDRLPSARPEEGDGEGGPRPGDAAAADPSRRGAAPGSPFGPDRRAAPASAGVNAG